MTEAVLIRAAVVGLKQFRVFFNDTATTEIYTLSLHDALPICIHGQRRRHVRRRCAEDEVRGARPHARSAHHRSRGELHRREEDAGHLGGDPSGDAARARWPEGPAHRYRPGQRGLKINGSVLIWAIMYVTCVALAGYAWAGATGRVPSGYGGSLKPTKILAAPSLIGTDLTVAVGNIFSTPDRAFPAGVRSSTLQINPYGGGDITPLYSRTTFQCASIRTLSMSSAKSLASLSPSFRSLTIEPRYGSNAATKQDRKSVGW